MILHTSKMLLYLDLKLAFYNMMINSKIHAINLKF